MELKSRIVFLDTNIYESRNFQFSSHALKAFKQLVDDGEIRLLITGPTIGEIRAHLNDKAVSAVKGVKALRKSAMILRNVPDFPVHGVFADINAEDVYSALNKNFEEFIGGENVEIVPIDGVSADQVFNRYFNLKPPFAMGEKRKEFSDAYVLLALKDFSRKRHWPVHVISCDRDMHRFSEEFPDLVCSESLDEFMDAVNKARAVEPSDFAEAAFDKIQGRIVSRAFEVLQNADVDVVDFLYGDEVELNHVEYLDLEFVSKNLLSVEAERCVYDVVFSVCANTLETARDYDRSPFDPEEGRYMFVLETLISKEFRVEFTAELVVGYMDRIEDSAFIEELSIPDDIVLANPLHVSYRQLDVSGD